MQLGERLAALNALEITPEFEEAVMRMQHGNQSLFLTGKAGTGKSTLLTYFRYRTIKKIAVLAPTGVAALNVQGETIHSFFKFKTNITPSEAEKQGRKIRNPMMYERLDAIVIDEISMVRADLLDSIDAFLRAALNSAKPFGGKQMIWIGDLYQLPPVVTRDEQDYFVEVYDSPYFFSAKAVQNPGFEMDVIELTKIYRQKDDDFISLLNAVRDGSIQPVQLQALNQAVVPRHIPSEKGTIQLTVTNEDARRINAQNLLELDAPVFSHTAEYSSDFELKMAPADLDLELKVGAQVMFLNNTLSGEWVNGTLGQIIAVNPEVQEVVVLTQNGDEVTVGPHQWKMIKHVYDPESKTLQQKNTGSFTQFPLKLAWAVTIHKSQGKTFKNVRIDLGRGAFAKGQVYVALSRCESLEGMQLTRPIKRWEILVDPYVRKFMETHLDN